MGYQSKLPCSAPTAAASSTTSHGTKRNETHLRRRGSASGRSPAGVPPPAGRRRRRPPTPTRPWLQAATRGNWSDAGGVQCRCNVTAEACALCIGQGGVVAIIWGRERD
jgi:hypothetical protein